MADGWFPLSASLIAHPKFKAATPMEKIYLLWIISEFNLSGEFYRSDLEITIVLKMSISKVRQARKKFQAMEWIQTMPGFRMQGRNLATQYLECGWAAPPVKGDGVFFAPIQRYTFEHLIAYIRKGWFTHADVWVYLALWFSLKKYRGDEPGGFFITKKDLCELTNIPQSDAVKKVERLYNDFMFKGGSHLFEFTDAKFKLCFKDWSICAVDEKLTANENACIQKQYSLAKERREKARKPWTPYPS
ncbi:MAG: hypothetical protein AB1656_13630 [Candidatus Omnitrophota bacterium]